MATENPFPLNIGSKSDSWEKLQLLANIDPEYKYTADEWNEITQALNYLYENQAGSVPSTTPATNKITFGLAAINNTSGDVTSVNEMIAAMNTVGFTITAGYLSVLEVQVYRNINGEKWRVFLRYLFKNNNITGTWGTGSTNGEININHLIELTWRPFIRMETDAEYNDLGDIGASTIEDYLNGLPTGTYTLNNLTKDYYFTCKINGQDQVYQVKNASLPLTISDDTVTGADFDLVASSDTPETQVIPTENQIKAKIVEATVSGTYELDIDTYSDFYLTQTAATELSFKAGTLPALASGKRFLVVATGDFPLTWADAFMNVFGDDYVGSKWNDHICEVVQKTAGYRGKVIIQNREDA